MLPDPMIETHGLARSFKTKTGPVAAVQGIDFEVRPGQIVGLLGPNGAGKTTTLRMLTTLLRPTTGSATVAGVDLRADPREVRRRIGYVAQIGATPAPGTILGEELVAQARLQGMSKADATSRLAELLPRLDLAGFERRALSEMSGGQRRRFDVALGLMHSPMLVFLDEPTTGLDPQSRANLWDHIRSLRDDQGVTIMLSTHYLDEADLLADRLLVMDGGQIVADDTPDALKARVSGDVVCISVDGDLVTAQQVAGDALHPRTSVIERDQLVLTVDRGDIAVPPLLRALDVAGIPLQSVQIHRPTLDDVFLTMTGRSLPRRHHLTEREARMLTETWVVFTRQMKQQLRNPVWVFFGLTQPILYLVLFGPLLTNIEGGGLGGENSWNVFVPGLLLQLVIFGAGFAGFGIIQELREGVVDRQRVTPARRVSLIMGRTVTNVVTIGVQAVILVAVAIPFGLDPSWSGVAVSILIVCLLSIGLAAASYAMGLIMQDEDSFAPFVQGVSLPLLLLSGVLLPMTLAPTWLRKLSELNPLTYVIDGVRDLFVGDFSTIAAKGALAALGVSVVLGWWATRRFGRASA